MTSHRLQAQLQVGGTLNPRRHIYIERPDDARLLKLLKAREYCNVLASRQMGKSSLMARTAIELKQANVKTVAIDVAGELGKTDTETWYQGLLGRIARDLGLDVEVPVWWRGESGSENQKLLQFFRDKVPASVTTPVVIFLDEIDSTLSLPYTDDLFTAIRTMYNDRAFGGVYEAITFCLIGVATPNELIKDRRTTPYNIGQTLILGDFDENRDDLSPLHQVLSDDPWHAKAILRKILYWTGGHPYLTLKFCAELRGSEGGDVDVDTYVEKSFTHLDRLREDTHFQDIDRFLRTRAINPSFDAFKLYQRILDGKREQDQTTFLHAYLKLSGLAKRDDDGYLVVRNRLYRRLFNSEWIREASPRYRWQLRRRTALLASAAAIFAFSGIGLWKDPRFQILKDAWSSLERDAGPIDRDSAATRELLPRSPIVRDITTDAIHRYSTSLEEGELLELIADPRGADVTLKLFDNENRPCMQVDAAGVDRPERLLWLATVKGKYSIEVSAAKDGSYRIEVVERRKATTEDRSRASAAKQSADGDTMSALGRTDVAIDYYLRALEIWQSLGDTSEEAYTLYRLGNVHQSSPAGYREAIGYYEHALRILSEKKDHAVEAATLHKLGNVLSRIGNIDEANGYYERALSIKEQVGDMSGRALILNDLAANYDVRGESQKALSLCERALEISREGGEGGVEAATLENRGRIYLGLGADAEALTDLLRALEIRQRLDDDPGLASALTSVSRVYERQEKFEEALSAAIQSVEIWRRVDDKLGLAQSLTILGSIHDRMGETDKALAGYREALEIFREEGSQRNEGIVMLELGRHYYSAMDLHRAMEHFDEALQLFREIGDRDNEAEGLLGMAKAEKLEGRLSPAKRRVESALEMIEDLRAKPARYDLRSSYLATKQDYYDFYVEVLMELHHQDPSSGYDGEALMVSERSRARSLLDLLLETGVDVRRGVDPELRRREDELERRINAKELERIQLLGGPDADDRRSAVERELRELLLEAEEVRAQIRLDSSYHSALAEPRLLGVEEIQQRILDDDTVLLEYDLGAGRSYLWVVAKDSIHSFELPGQAEIEGLARRAYNLLQVGYQRRYGRFAEESLEHLSEVLLGSAGHLLGDKRLLVVGEGTLQYIPFGSLPIPGPSEDSHEPPRYLITEHEVVTIPSATTIAVVRQEVSGREPATGTLAVVADPVFDRNDDRFPSADERSPVRLFGLERLVHSGEEARTILSLVPPEKAFSALGFNANRETVLSGRLAGYRFVHFATHGILNAEQPELSGVVLSMMDDKGRPVDGFLRAHDIYNLELRADLVVLSAGNTALGKEVHGEGLIGLTRAFMYAGAPRVVASLWSVDDRATSELMVRFYRELLQEGLSPAAALRAAQISIARELQWQAPYYWAGFIFQGEWR